MSQSTLEKKPTTGNKVETTHRYLGIVSTSLGIAGAVGTLFVWLTANFYVGEIEIRTTRPISSLTVKAYNPKGSEAVFHTPRFQLMPGAYHLEIIPEGSDSIHHDTNVQFNNKTIINVTVPEGSGDNAAGESNGKRHWWQFWR
jgi:hypothetical protein